MVISDLVLNVWEAEQNLNEYTQSRHDFWTMKLGFAVVIATMPRRKMMPAVGTVSRDDWPTLLDPGFVAQALVVDPPTNKAPPHLVLTSIDQNPSHHVE
jgi:hypothetical protein